MDELVEWLRTQIEAKRADADSLHDLGRGEIRYDGLCDCGIPAEVIARCDVDLAILDEHRHYPVPFGEPFKFGCGICSTGRDLAPEGDGWCRTVRLVASGYRHRDGYEAEWKP